MGIITVKSILLSGEYDKTKFLLTPFLQIANEVFDTSNHGFTSIKNPKSFELELSNDEFRIEKLNKHIYKL